MNPTKLVLHFSDFFYDFLGNLQESAKTLIQFKNHFAAGTLEGFGLLHMCPCFAERASGRVLSSQCGPWGAGRRGSGGIPAGAGGGASRGGAGEVH
jgi:hypothetical protein